MKVRRQEESSKYRGPRRAGLNTLIAVYGHGAYADIVLAEELLKVHPRDRALTTEIVYGVLRRGINIDWIIENISYVKIKKMENLVLTALRVGVYQIYFLSNIPLSAAVNESVKLVKGAKKKGFVNAVLRKAAAQKEILSAGPSLDRDELTRLSITGSHPKWLVKRWCARYGKAGTEALLQANLKTPRKTLRANTMRITRDDLIKKLNDNGLTAKKTIYSPFALDVESGPLPPEIKETGLAIAQDEASQLVAMLAAPRPGELILDACAAPGGKTTHMAQMMKNKGSIIAVDKYAGRLKTLTKIAAELGLSIIKPLCGDSEKKTFQEETSKNPFNAILVDAPCSGLGVLGRTPDIKLRRTEKDILALAERQKRLLHNLLPLLKPGGRLIYSVCTLEPEETTEVVEFFLREHEEIYLEDGATILPQECAELVDKDGFLKTLPQSHAMDGFFAARFIKE